jgi:3-oxoacyl-[acyl-carrier protein] reductase
MRELRGARSVVTGAASGIGRALALALSREGADLFLVDLDAEGLGSVADEARAEAARVETAVFDLASADAVADCADAILSAPTPPRLLVNNAGVAWRGKAARMPRDEVERVLAVNLLAPIRLTQRLLPTLLEQPDPHVLNVCSLAGLVAIRGLALYSASKSGLVGYSEGLRRDHGGRLGVTALCPGFVDTPMLRDIDAARGRRRRRGAGAPDEVARRALAAVRADRALVVVSPAARLLWWAHRIHPGMGRRRR